ncbi:MAG: hypothetical protein R3C49_07230 [Planctomycetaceae bacterium]
MPTASATKASDKAAACKKLTTLLQKDYGKSVPKLKLPVLETMLFSVCLEDNPWDKAEAAYQRLLKSFFDMNEIRVSSVTEIERILNDLRFADWKGGRIRSILRFVFESTYSFDFEKLSKLTLESAQKRLKKIDYLSPFITNFTLQQVLGVHVVCLDDSSHRAAIHLGLVPGDMNIEDAGEFIKGGLKKADTFGFCHLLRCFSTDPQFIDRLKDPYEEEGEFDVTRVADRLAVLKAPKKKSKPAPKKADPPAEKPAPAKKAAAKATEAKPADTKPAETKPASAKAAAKPAAAKPTAKAASTKPVTPDKKPAAKKTTPAKATTTSKGAAKKSATRDSSKKTPAKAAVRKKK